MKLFRATPSFDWPPTVEETNYESFLSTKVVKSKIVKDFVRNCCYTWENLETYQRPQQFYNQKYIKFQFKINN